MLMQQKRSSSRCGVNTVPLSVAILAASQFLRLLAPRLCTAPELLCRALVDAVERLAASAVMLTRCRTCTCGAQNRTATGTVLRSCSVGPSALGGGAMQRAVRLLE